MAVATKLSVLQRCGRDHSTTHLVSTGSPDHVPRGSGVDVKGLRP
jgi:hypothetical protein